jgi:hypothetical protein
VLADNRNADENRPASTRIPPNQGHPKLAGGAAETAEEMVEPFTGSLFRQGEGQQKKSRGDAHRREVAGRAGKGFVTH